MLFALRRKGETVDPSEIGRSSRGELFGLEHQHRCIELDVLGQLDRVMVYQVLVWNLERYVQCISLFSRLEEVWRTPHGYPQNAPASTVGQDRTLPHPLYGSVPCYSCRR